MGWGELVGLENKKYFSGFYIGGFMHKSYYEKREKVEMTSKIIGTSLMESSGSIRQSYHYQHGLAWGWSLSPRDNSKVQA